MMAARQMFLGRRAGGAKLPYDAEVEYLESTGTQYIDTRFKANTGTTSFEISLTQKNINQYPQGLFGSRNTASAANSSFNAFMMSGGVVRADFVGSARNLNSGMTDNSLFVIRYDNRKVYVNGVSDILSYAENSTLQDYNFLVGSFTNGSDTPYSGGFVGLIRYVRLWSSDVLVRDLIPVRFTNEQGVSEGAMYDRVSKRLFRNAGTGSFVVGRDVNPISARSYVTDGLVAMWDGIEQSANTFSISYDAASFVLADGWLTNSSATTKYVEAPASSIQSVIDAYHSGEITEECVFRWNLVHDNSQFLRLEGNVSQTLAMHSFASSGGDVPLLYIRDSTAGSVAVFSPPTYTDKFYAAHVISKQAGKAIRYCNSTSTQATISTTTDFSANIPTGIRISVGGRNNFAVGCIRFYNRALSAAEIAVNCAVDKQRFNLP